MLRAPIVLALLALPWMALAESDVEAVEACVSRNLPVESGVIDFAVQVRDREGGVTGSGAQLSWRRPGEGLSRMVLRITEPPRTRGTAVLVVEREDEDPDLFVYVPELSKVKRVRKSRLRGSLFGTDFSYEDLERVQGLAQRTELRLLQDFELGDRTVWVLEARPDPDAGSEYSRVLTYIDQEYCLPLRMEFVDRHGKLRKVLKSDPALVRRDGDRFLPAEFLMRDLRDGTETRLTLRNVAIDPELREDQFTQQSLSAFAP